MKLFGVVCSTGNCIMNITVFADNSDGEYIIASITSARFLFTAFLPYLLMIHSVMGGWDFLQL